MRTNILKLLRTAAVVLALGFVTTPTADAGWWSRLRGTSTPTATEATPEKPRGDPLRGALAVAGGVAVLVFLAWVASRIGDTGR